MLILNIENYHTEMEETIDMLSFYNDEISSLEKRLEEVVVKNTKQPILAQVEHFQNMLVVLHEKFVQLKHDIQCQKVRMKEYVTTEKEPLNNIQVNSHKLREEILMTTKIFTETKHACYQFLAKVL